MGKRTHLLLVVAVSLIASTVGIVAAMATGVEPASACSIAGPYAEVHPAANLQPGQQIEVVGWGFYDIRVNPPSPEPAPDQGQDQPADQAVPDLQCDFATAALTGLDVIWHGAGTQRLGTVGGPDFAFTTRVPDNAASGAASISVGPATVQVMVGPDVPPPPCPLTVLPDGTDHHICPDPDPWPDPWPCPAYEAQAGSAQPAPGADAASGFLSHCPEPCVDYAHTIDQDSAYYPWDCPDPCGYPEANPDAAEAVHAVWCPPPDPCPVYIAQGAPAGVAIDEALVACPDPCGLVGGDAVWCPPPYPCSAAALDENETFCPQPWPDPPANQATASAAASEAASTDEANVTISAPSPGSMAAAEPAITVYLSISHRVIQAAHQVMTLLFG